MSKVDEYTRPDWTKANEGTVFWDTRCLTCGCCNSHSCLLDELGSSWGSFTRDGGNIEYAVFQTKEFLPTCMLIGLCPCFFIHFCIMACIPMTEAVVIGFNRETHETFAEVRVKSMCGGWITQSRKQLGEMTCAIVPAGLIKSATASVNIFSDDGRDPLKIPLTVNSDDSKAGCKGDIEGFVRAANQIIDKSRRRGGIAGGAPPPYDMEREEKMVTASVEVYAPNSIHMATAVPVHEPAPPPRYSQDKWSTLDLD
jgi:hypothetical protein